MIKPEDLPSPLLAVRAFIKDGNGKILILKRASSDNYGDQWNLPGGKVDYGQTAEEAIRREIQEETSLVCTSTQFLFYLDGLPEKPDAKHYLTLFFDCLVQGEISLNRESIDIAWMIPGEMSKYDFAFRTDSAINNYYKDV